MERTVHSERSLIRRLFKRQIHQHGEILAPRSKGAFTSLFMNLVGFIVQD